MTEDRNTVSNVVDSLPPPPAYYKIFARDLTTGIAKERDAIEPAFPLKPPPPPGPGDTYKMFGIPYSAEPVAEELLPPEKQVIPAPGTPVDYRAELKRLLWSLMVNYQQFLIMLTSCPSQAHKKVSDLETLFVNMHSLLNRYRGHQARHILLCRMRRQLATEETTIASLEKAMKECCSQARDAEEQLRTADWGESGSSTSGLTMATGGDQALVSARAERSGGDML